jgi:hypothetical protein
MPITSVSPADSTVAFIRKVVRRLTASPNESSLNTADLDQILNYVYLNDFPYAIKIDQMRSDYTFYTQPNIDRYPLDVNFNQGVRAPFYVDGILGSLFKDRTQFYNLWPKWPTLFNPIAGDGMTTAFSFTIPGPFLSKEVTIGGVDASGNPISVNDDGLGNLRYLIPNPIVSVPLQYNPPASNPPIPGMFNINTQNPGLINVNTQTTTPTSGLYLGVGTVNYVSGLFNINFPVAPAKGTQITLRVSQYDAGRPYCLLFWNNEFTIRPVPKFIHKVDVETYLTPVQFMESTDLPTLNQWALYLAYLTAQEIYRQRQDFEGVANLEEGRMRQEGLVLERQGIEEIGQPTFTLFNSAQSYSVYGGYGGAGYP